VRQALAAAVPPPRKAHPRRKPAIDPWSSLIDGWLTADRDAPKNHSARRVWQRLVAEHEATLAEVTVSRYVARRRVELGLDQREVSQRNERRFRRRRSGQSLVRRGRALHQLDGTAPTWPTTR
jgi:hypothetical protein